MVEKSMERRSGKDFIGVGVGGVIANNNKEILLLLRNIYPEKGLWSIPGGGVEYGEKVEDALKRELREELGIEVAIDKLLCVTNHILESENCHWVSPAFLVRIVSGIPENKEEKGHLEMKWFPFNKLPQNLAVPAVNAIKSYEQLQMK